MLNFIPCTPGQKFPALKSWSKTVPYDGEVGDERLLVAGCTSGIKGDENYPNNGVECLDFDDGGSAFKEYWSVIEDSIKDKCYVERTPSGGYHIIYRSPYVKGNKQLAWNEEGDLIIETRGYGGLIKTAPSPNYIQISSRCLNDDLPILSQEEVDRLWQVALFLNRKEEEKPKNDILNIEKPVQMTGDSPADYLRNEGKDIVRRALTKAGWQEVKEDERFVFFSHPNATNPKDIHLSWHKDNGSIHNWSNNKCAPFNGEGDFSPLEALALLEYNGDISACGLDIRRRFMNITSTFHVDEEEEDPIIDEEYAKLKRPEFDIRLEEFPFVLQDFVKAAMSSAKVKQTTLAIFSGLSAASYVISRRLRKATTDGEMESYNLPLFVMAISESGTGKEAPLRAARKLAEMGSFDCNAIQPMGMSQQAMGESIIEHKKMFYACDEAGDAIFFDKSNVQLQIKRIMKELFSSKDFRMPEGVGSKQRLKEKFGNEHGVAYDQTTVFYATGCPEIVIEQMTEQDLSEGLAGRFIYCLGDLKAKKIFSLKGNSSAKFPQSVYDWCKMWKSVANPDYGLSFDEQITRELQRANDPDYDPEKNEEVFKEPETVDLSHTTLIVIDDETDAVHNEMANFYYDQGRKCRTGEKGMYLRAGLAIETIGVTLACLEAKRDDAIHLEPRHIKLAQRIVDYSIKCVRYLLGKKMTTENSTASTKEGVDIFRKLVKKLSSHTKDSVTHSLLTMWFRGIQEKVWMQQVNSLVTMGGLSIKQTTKGTSYTINKKKLEDLA